MTEITGIADITGIFGGLLLLAAGGLLGHEINGRRRRRLRGLYRLVEGLYQLERELSQQLTPLPTLFQREGLPFGPYFSACGRALEEGDSLAESWDRLVLHLPHLGEEERRLIRPLGQILGRFEGEVQGLAILRVTRDLEGLAGRLEGDDRRLSRVYPALGITSAAFLAIILI